MTNSGEKAEIVFSDFRRHAQPAGCKWSEEVIGCRKKPAGFAQNILERVMCRKTEDFRKVRSKLILFKGQ